MFVLSHNGALGGRRRHGQGTLGARVHGTRHGRAGPELLVNQGRQRERVFVRAEGAIQGIDAKTGKSIRKFGINGKVPLQTGMSGGTPTTTMGQGRCSKI